MDLARQVQQLKEQIAKYENNGGGYTSSIGSFGGNKCSTNQNPMEKELEYLRTELMKTKINSESSGEMARTLEKYERQKDYLAEHNQASFLVFDRSVSQKGFVTVFSIFFLKNSGFEDLVQRERIERDPFEK